MKEGRRGLVGNGKVPFIICISVFHPANRIITSIPSHYYCTVAITLVMHAASHAYTCLQHLQ